PRTLHSLYPVPHRPCIHYIWSPRTLHSLYLVSQDPAFTIWSPTVHRTWKFNYFSKYKLLNNFSHQQYIAIL
ncbi:unnamed protein product, partial [Staurois parvus]